MGGWSNPPPEPEHEEPPRTTWWDKRSRLIKGALTRSGHYLVKTARLYGESVQRYGEYLVFNHNVRKWCRQNGDVDFRFLAAAAELTHDDYDAAYDRLEKRYNDALRGQYFSHFSVWLTASAVTFMNFPVGLALLAANMVGHCSAVIATGRRKRSLPVPVMDVPTVDAFLTPQGAEVAFGSERIPMPLELLARDRRLTFEVLRVRSLTRMKSGAGTAPA